MKIKIKVELNRRYISNLVKDIYITYLYYICKIYIHVAFYSQFNVLNVLQQLLCKTSTCSENTYMQCL